MNIKTYRCKSIPSAIEQIKRELGSEAVILSTRESRKRRFLGLFPSLTYEVTAAVEPSSPGSSDKRRGDAVLNLSLNGAAERPKERSEKTAPADATGRSVESYEPASLSNGDDREEFKAESSARPAPVPTPMPEPRTAVDGEIVGRIQGELERMSRDLGELRRSVVYRVPISARRALNLPSPMLESFHRLVGQGIEESLAFSLLRKARRTAPTTEQSRDQIDRCVHEALKERIRVSPISGNSDREACVAAFIGPTGVGKTTTIAKLAAVFALKEKKKVQLITLDTYRIAAAEQLKTYGDIIGVPVRVVLSVKELAEALEDLRDRECVLIDTAGLSPRRVKQFGEPAEFLRSREGIEKHLVLSATTRLEDLRETVRCFEDFGPNKLIFTKLDEASSYGAVTSELIRSGKPLSYLTDGQSVPDDLVIPTAGTFADLIVSVNRGQRT